MDERLRRDVEEALEAAGDVSPTFHTSGDPGVDEGGPWCAVIAECRLCGHQWAAVFPADTDYGALECSRCGAQQSRIVRDIPTQAEG
jgi:hypothetical protein